MPLLLLGHIHTVASSTSLCCSYTCILHLLSLLHIACFLLMQPQAAMIRSTAGTPTTSVQPAPETATSTPLASAGCPQVRLARFTLQNQLLANPFVRISIDVYRLRCPNACCYYRRRLPQLRITRAISHPVTINSISKMLSQGVLLWGG